MSYSHDPVVNDCVLAIINDGDGSQSGMTYEQRCKAGRHPLGYVLFSPALNHYGRWRIAHDASMPTVLQRLEARKILWDYYKQHIAEMAAS